MASHKRAASPPETPPRQTTRSGDQVKTPPRPNKKAKGKAGSELAAGTPGSPTRRLAPSLASSGVRQSNELDIPMTDPSSDDDDLPDQVDLQQVLAGLAQTLWTPNGQSIGPPPDGSFMASADGLPPLPFGSRSDLSATTHLNSPEALGMNQLSLGPNSDPSPNQSSGPTLQNRLLADPARVAFYNARIHAAGRTSNRAGDPIFPTSTSKEASRQSVGHEQPTMQTFGQTLSGVLNYAQANPESANFHGNLSTYRSNPSDQVGLSTDSDVVMTDMENPDQQETTNPSHQGFLPGSVRDRPRTRFHPSFGHAGIDRSYRSQTQTGRPVVAQTPAFPQPLTGPFTCNEQPEFWEKGVLSSYSYDPRENEVTTHSGPMTRCSNVRAHTGTHLVCTKCHGEGSEHLKEHFGDLLPYPKFFQLCNRCARGKVGKPADPKDVNQDGKLVGFQCRCNNKWECFGCRLNDMRAAKISYDQEIASRRGMSMLFGGGKTVQLEDVCVCGDHFDGTERSYQCVTCREVRKVPV
ncbi:MAG: hypothetical protein Q9228_001253 [Teloschistes exilis]